MSKNKIFAVIIILILVIIMLLAIVINYCAISNRDYLLIEEDGVYFGIGKRALIAIKGNPVRVNKNVVDTPMDEYVFEDEIGGYFTICSYSLYHSRLHDVSFVIEDIECEEALALSRNIIEKQKLHYSKYDGYYDAKESVDAEVFRVSHGVETGAGGFLFEYQYASGVLTIRAFMQK